MLHIFELNFYDVLNMRRDQHKEKKQVEKDHSQMGYRLLHIQRAQRWCDDLKKDGRERGAGE